MLHICGVSKTFGEWYQKTNKAEDTNKLTLFAFKIIAIPHNTRLATFIKLLETVSKGLFRNRSQNSCHTFLDCRRAAAKEDQDQDQPWGPTSLLLQWIPGLSRDGKAALGVALTTQLHPAPRLKNKESCKSAPFRAFVACYRVTLTFIG
jgi:hypothetical protein